MGRKEEKNGSGKGRKTNAMREWDGMGWDGMESDQIRSNKSDISTGGGRERGRGEGEGLDLKRSRSWATE